MKDAMVKNFENKEFGEIRVVERNGEPWFVAADVCGIFGVTNNRNVTARLDDDEKGVSIVDTPGGKQNMTMVNEAGLYHILFTMEPNNARSVTDEKIANRIEKLKAFKRWITHDVIPSIRKTGGYVANDEIFIDTYLPFADDATKALFRATLHTINAQNKKIKEIEGKLEDVSLQNRVLSGEMLQWDEGPLLNALVRKYGNVACHDNFGKAWKDFYKELLYKHSIGLEQRKTLDINSNPSHKGMATYKYLTVEEFPLAIQAIVAMCVDVQVEIDDILKMHLRQQTQKAC